MLGLFHVNFDFETAKAFAVSLTHSPSSFELRKGGETVRDATPLWFDEHAARKAVERNEKKQRGRVDC